MSKAQFEQAGQHIKRREYDKARDILETMPENPTAQKWLAKLDEIDPPFPEIEASPRPVRSSSFSATPDKNKRMSSSQKTALLDEEVEKAQKGGRIVGGFMIGIGAFIALGMLIMNPLIQTRRIPLEYGSVDYPPSSSAYIMTAIVVGLGLFFVCLGIYQYWYAGRADKIRETLAKGKAKNIKRAGFMFLGVAVVWAFTAILTKQTSNLGTSIIWAIAGGIMLLYQLPKAEEFDRQQGLTPSGEKVKRSEE